MDRASADRWLEAYVEAWTSYDRDQIGALFAEDVRYRYHPYDEPLRGRDAVVESWLGEGDASSASTPDQEGTYSGSYRVVATDGEVVVATGTTTYAAEPGGDIGRIFHNCFVMRFDRGGLCQDFTEWYIEQPRT